VARTLDKSRKFGNIFGVEEHGAVFTQDGCLFNGQGQEVGEGITAPLADPPRVAAAGPALKEPVAAPTAAESLAALHPAQLGKLVTEAGMTPFGGPGSKQKNIKLLIDHVAASD